MGTVKEEIAKNLLYYRKKSNLTQKQLAEKLGVKNSAVSNWENGANSIDIETLFQACNIFGITLNDIYGLYAIPEHKKIEPLPHEDEGIVLYNSLDDIDKAEIRGEMKQMLKAEKYKQDNAELA